jgi:glutamine synthetase
MPKNIVIPSNRAEDAFNEGISFDASSIAGYATIEESDMIAKPDPSSFVILPKVIEKRKTAKMNCDIYEPNGDRYIGDPKYALERMMEKAKKMGFVYLVGPECEFFLFKKGDRFEPSDSAGYFDLSHRDLAEDVRADISLALKDLGSSIYTSHHEVAGGQHEIDLKHADALTIADRIITLKYVTKVIASLHGLHASFMPKPIHGECGNGMHVHQSLATLDGKNAFYDPNEKNQLSDLAEHFIAGLLKCIKEITAILNPTVNSYKRLVPGYEAPTYISWANRNRSALIRIPVERGKGTRCELRSPDPSGNPYLQFAVMLAAGLKGIEEKLDPPRRVEKDIYPLSAEERSSYGIEEIPDNLRYALAIMEESDLVRETLGDHIFNHFLHIKREEWDKYKTRVTKWEIEEYLPIL